MGLIVLNGNNIELLKNYPDNYFDSVVTDPPYGLGKEPNPSELMRAWLETGYHEIQGKGFMGKEWDAFVPQPIFWKEVFRVLKHGGHVVAFYGTRTYDWGVMAMRLAGFEVRDCIQWIYGSGFPKSHNIGKAIDKIQGNKREIIEEKRSGSTSRAYQSEEKTTSGLHFSTKGSSDWEGWGSALKPANEPIVLARKPLEKGLSIAENVLKWGTGGINIDKCRIATNDNLNGGAYSKETTKIQGSSYTLGITGNDFIKPEGRFPANIILDEDAAEILDEQSGISKSNDRKRNRQTLGSFGMPNDETPEYNDKGGASRFFYVAKASKSERNKGLDDFEEKPLAFSNQAKAELKRGNSDFDGGDAKGHGNSIRHLKNFHPTVKPVKLMQYLVRLVTPPNGKVLDPFCGSGTTGIACKLEGF